MNLPVPSSLVLDGDIEQLCLMAIQCPPGAFIEVGVYKGGTAWNLAQIAREQWRRLYLCDTFKGIPHFDEEMGDKHKVGDFSDVDPEYTMKQFADAGFVVNWVVGVFPESASIIPANERFAFAHLDCDQYRSVKESAEWLIPRMVPGGVIWFDDVDRLAGATRAAEELFAGRILRDRSHAYVRL